MLYAFKCKFELKKKSDVQDKFITEKCLIKIGS